MTRRPGLGAAVRIIGAVLGALIYVLGVGFLTIRAKGVEKGVRVDWLNTPVQIGSAGSPWLQYAAVAVLTLVALVFLWPRADQVRHNSSWAPAATVALILIFVSGWFLATTQQPYPGPIEAALITANPAQSPIQVPDDSAVMAWARTGGLSPATHTFAAAALVIAFRTAQRGRTHRTET